MTMIMEGTIFKYKKQNSLFISFVDGFKKFLQFRLGGAGAGIYKKINAYINTIYNNINCNNNYNIILKTEI